MSKTALIIGGSGKVSRQLTALLVGQTPNPWTVHSLIRKESQKSALELMGAHPIVQSIEDSSVDELAATIHKLLPLDVVVWSAGAGGGDPSRTKSVDEEGAIKVMDAIAKTAGIKRFVIVSALDLRERNMDPPAWYNENDLERSEKVWSAIGPYMRAKLAADKELVTGNDKRELDYTIVRPGQLIDEDATGNVDAGQVHLGAPISRGDVARVIVECIKNDGTIGMAFDVVGGSTPVKQAVEQVVAGKLDTFKGYH